MLQTPMLLGRPTCRACDTSGMAKTLTSRLFGNVICGPSASSAVAGLLVAPLHAEMGWKINDVQEAAPPEAPTLEPIADDAQLEKESQWLAKGIQTWLDEEWQLQDNHRDVGKATAQVC